MMEDFRELKTKNGERQYGRASNELRPISFVINPSKHAEGSCLVKFGDTQVFCTATIEDGVPVFLRGQNKGWITAEYGMLPRATGTRTKREAKSFGQNGRTQEIQRLIGRSLRSAINLDKVGERQITIDCDVIQADGGTRTASISGGFVALYIALEKLVVKGTYKEIPISNFVAAVSCGIYNGKSLLDLDYVEDSNCEADSNFVMTDSNKIVEIQGTAEKKFFSKDKLYELLDLAEKGIAEIISLQKKALGI